MTTRRIYAMKQKAFEQHGARFWRIRRAAFPDTGGHPQYVHNWYACRRDNGPEQRAAEAISGGEWSSWHRIDARLDRWYAAAEHRQHAARGHDCRWCRFCPAYDLAYYEKKSALPTHQRYERSATT